jgi:multidrug resistance efflux pump
MPHLFPPEILENTVECYHARIHTRSKVIYGLLLAFVLLVVVSLPLVYVDISSQSRGIIRSPYENTTIQSALYGEVVRFELCENKKVNAGDTLIVLNNKKLNEQLSLLSDKINENVRFKNDIENLLINKSSLSTPKYKGEYLRYKAKLNELEVNVNYLKKELNVQKSLYEQHVISQYEYLQSKNLYEKSNEQLRAVQQDFRSGWLVEKTRLEIETTEYQSNIEQLRNELRQYVITAPSTGTLVQVAGIQKGNFISPGQSLAIISTDDSLLAECFISPADIGYVNVGQTVKFQFDAFNYRDWGMVQGSVDEVLQDVVLIEKQPMFRVRCKLDSKKLQLKSGYQGTVKKGLTFTARFHLNRRSLSQLLFDKVDNWLNPKLLAEKK